MKAKLFVIIALLVAAFSFPPEAEAQVKVRVSAKGLLNAVAKEAKKAANKKTEQAEEETSGEAETMATGEAETTETGEAETMETGEAETTATDDDLIIPLYSGSDIRYDDQIGFEEFPLIMNDSTVQNTEGVLRRVFCRAPEGRSPLEIIKNYENAIKEDGGVVLFISRSPKDIVIDDQKFGDLFRKNRKDLGLSTYVFTHTTFPELVTEYLLGKLSTTDKDIYIIVAAGPGAWAASEDNKTFYELVILEAEPMEMGMVTSADIGKGLSTLGRIAIYSIFFDTGKSEVKPESADALKVIAEYLNANKAQKVLIVGHTDNTGDFDMNISLSKDRADAVMEKLITEYAVAEDQLKPYGAGPIAPVASNSTEQGRAQNRRVEIVEQ
jgi:outer membrane protein OmpA-like peptidoglycan-associated protein